MVMLHTGSVIYPHARQCLGALLPCNLCKVKTNQILFPFHCRKLQWTISHYLKWKYLNVKSRSDSGLIW